MNDDLDTLKTQELITRIEDELGLVFDRNTITAWTRREEDPLPVAYKGKGGQAHRYSWTDFLAWYDREIDRTEARTLDDIDSIDYHEARTIDMRERAKRSMMETQREAETLVEVSPLQAAVEDLGRQAVNMLLAIPARIAPQLATMTDETAVDALLQSEIRTVCNLIANAKPGDDLDPEPEPALQAA